MKLEEMFEQAGKKKRYLRALVYGEAKSGKSHFCWTATRVGPVFWIDTEKGAEFYDAAEGFGFRAIQTSSISVAVEAIRAAGEYMKRTGQVPVIVIDSFTSTWEDQKEVAEQLTEQWSRGKIKDRASFRAWAVAKKPIKELYELIHEAPCHIIVTARRKEEYEVDDKGNPVLVDTKADAEKKLDYAMDIIAEIGHDSVKRGQPLKPDQYWLRIVGCRGNELAAGTTFTNPSFSDLMIAARLEGDEPTGVKSDVEDQVQESTATNVVDWPTLVAAVTARKWDVAAVKEALKNEFGSFDVGEIARYWNFIETTFGGTKVS